MKLAINMLLFFVVLFTVSCKKNNEINPDKLRTILVYMGGDNNLYNETFEKVEALRKGYTKGMGRLLIYQDAAGMNPRLIEITTDLYNKGIVKELKEYAPENSASATVFKRVLEEMKLIAPSSSYGLILFSHASGWLPQRTLIKPYSVAQDEKSDLEIRDFAEAIPDHYFDFMIFEACFMTGIEVAYELKDKTNFIMASSAEILSPGFTLLYPKVLPYLFKSDFDLELFAEDYYQLINDPDLTENYRSATISIIKTAGLAPLAAHIKQHVIKALPDGAMQHIQHYDRYATHRLFFDFNDYYQQILSPEGIDQFSHLLNETVIYKKATPSFLIKEGGFIIKNFSGLTSYIPQQSFSYLNDEYQKLNWVKETRK
jgi:hypothetical protein